MSDGRLAGYILIRAGTKDVHHIRECLRAVPGMGVVHPLIGPDDLICYIERADADDFQNALDTGIRSLIDDGTISNTETLLILGYGTYSFFGLGDLPGAAAWLMCELNVGNPEPVARALRGIKGVVNANPVIGRFDMVAYVEAESLPELMRILDGELRHVPGLARTDTRLVLM